MEHSKNKKRVSWASGSNLCQTKYFSSPSPDNKFDESPPGFERDHFKNQSKSYLPHIPVTIWKSPPSFALNRMWRVAAGESSDEKQLQERRETQVKEVVYPSVYPVRQNPAIYQFVEEECYDDTLTPLVPLEEEEEHPIANMHGVAKEVGSTAVETKNDDKYCKNPITKHDGTHKRYYSTRDKYENTFQDRKRRRSDNINEPREEVRSRSSITCKFFNSRRGCRNGNSCPYWHDRQVHRQGGKSSVARDDKILRL